MKNTAPYISVIAPVYGCKECLHELHDRLTVTLSSINENYEILLVNDSSPDNSWVTIEELCKADEHVKGLSLSRNFGQHAAISAGLENAKGEWVIVMDCDLQDQPEEIIKLHLKALEGFDIVLARRINRKDTYLKKTFSKYFYKFLSYMTETNQDSTIANFGIYNRKVISAINRMEDHIRFFPTMVKWVGFKLTSIEIIHAERSVGETSYNFKKLLKLATDTTLSFSDKPLRLTIKVGMMISILSFIFALYNLYLFTQGAILITGWTSLIISIWFLSGLIIAIIGTVGLYIGKIFEKVKNRPVYILDKKINIE
jgi:glycosyltransferase involved in cell wall biosynthesis